MLDPNEQLIADLLASCYDAPGLFNEAILGRQPYWWRQVEICDSIVAYKTTIVESGNSVGKSYIAAGIILWWLYTRPVPLVVTTAPSQTLLGTVLFKELRKAHSGSRVPLGGTITVSPNASPQTLMLPDGASVLGIATKGVERFSGQHNPNLLALVDEGSGIDEQIWEAIFSQKPKKLVVFGNPLKADGPFVDLARRGERERENQSIPRHRRANTITIPSTDSPDIHLEESPRGLADRGFIEESKRQYGEASLWYRTHVKALRPTASHDGLIPPEWIDVCCGAVRSRDHPWGVRRIGCDLGEGVGRDKTVIVVRDDLGVLEWSANHGMGLAEAAAEIARLARKYRVRDEHITYDALGIGRDLPLDLERHGITEAIAYKGSYSGGTDFTNLRTAAAWQLRLRLEPGRDGPPIFAIPADDHWGHFRKEIGMLRYDLVGEKTRLEPKEDLCKRLGHSPDYADALIQTFAVMGD